MKKIILLTVGFPFGNHEPFLQNELEYLGDVTIVSSYIGPDTHVNKNLPQNVKVVHPDTLFFKGNKFVRVFKSLLAVLSYSFWNELLSSGIKPINTKKVIQLLSGISKARELFKYISKSEKATLINCKNRHDIVIYSYWMNQLALCAYWLGKKYKIKAVCRCHGYDLYPRKENNYYVTFQNFLLQKMDFIYPISNDGKNTLINIDKKQENKIIVSRLGTTNQRYSTQKQSDVFTIVSCSNVTELKRVDLIAKSLSYIKDIRIKWVHFGDGPLLDHVRKIVNGLPENVEVDLKGRVSNTEVKDYYKNNYVSLFINTSTSEGIPVSIMEAMSYGIPCLATDVGGTHEIVNDENGLLVGSEISAYNLSNLIIRFSKTNNANNEAYRKKAYYTWHEQYNAKENYAHFFELLNGI